MPRDMIHALFEELSAADLPVPAQAAVVARGRQRRVRARVTAVVCALAVVAAAGSAVGFLQHAAGLGGQRPASQGGSAKGGPAHFRPSATAGTAAGHFTFRGNGIGAATFGQPETAAIAELDKVLGSPATPRPTGDAGNCTVDAYLIWPTLTAYFFRGRFVGYNSASLLGAQVSGAPNVIPGASTAAGLRIGDDVAQARRIYGSALAVLSSQGGSWRVTTSAGMLDGYLTAVPGRPTPPVPRIADVSAGSVGCPAASP
jgi:hypothetical protein